MDNTATEQINGKAIISLVLGSVTLVLPIIGIVTGIMGIIYYNKAKKEMKLTGETGEGVNITGLTLSIVGLVFQVFTTAIIGLFLGLMIFDTMTYY